MKMDEKIPGDRELQYLFLQLHELSKNWIIADSDGTCNDRYLSPREGRDRNDWRHHDRPDRDHDGHEKGGKRGDHYDHTKQARAGRLGRDPKGRRRV